MQTNQPEGGPQSPSQQRRGTLDAENDRPQDPRPLGGSDTPHQHPFPTKSMDPRPLGAGKSVPGEIEAEDTEQDDNNKAAAAKGPLHDEVDASPEEQFTRHHVELDPERIHHMQYHKEGPLEQVKKKAVSNIHGHSLFCFVVVLCCIGSVKWKLIVVISKCRRTLYALPVLQWNSTFLQILQPTTTRLPIQLIRLKATLHCIISNMTTTQNRCIWLK